MCEWSTKPLSEIAENISRPFNFKGKDKVIFINTGDVLEGKFLHNDYSLVKGLPGQAKKAIKKGDILYSEIRPGNKRYVFVDFDADDYVVSTKFMVIRATADVSPEYLYMILTSYSCEQEFKIIAESRSGTFPQITFDSVSYYPVRYPGEKEQERLVSISNSLLDKIDLNRQTNQTLEQIAQAIFKSWFVDFDPVRAKASCEPPESICRRLGLTPDLLALFPNSLVDSELGEIPKGWETTTLGELCERVSMGPFGSDIKTSNFVPEGVPVIRGGNLTAGFVENSFVFLTEKKADQLRNANASSGDVVITHRGTLGQIGLIPSRSRYPRYVVSQSQMVLTVKKERATSRFVYEYLRTPGGKQALLANTSQVGVPAIARPTTSVKAIALIAPEHKLLEEYDLLTGPLFELVQAKSDESRTMAHLRETLLPRLLSGELTTKKTKADKEAVA